MHLHPRAPREPSSVLRTLTLSTLLTLGATPEVVVRVIRAGKPLELKAARPR